MRANVARRFATLTCLQSVRLFSQNFTSYQIKIILRCFRRDIPGMPFSAKQTRVYGGGVRGMTIPTGIGLKFTLTPVNPPQRLIIIARNFSIYVIFYKIRSCREPSKQFVQLPIAYKQFFFLWEALEYLLRVLWFSERSVACRPG